MRKLILTVILIFCLSVSVFAKSDNASMPVVKFNGSKFSLCYSAKSTELAGYINEYYKQRESYASWSELVALHHYPNAFYPIEHAKAFQEFLDESGIVNFLEIDEENNSAIIDFIIIDNSRFPIIIEFNIFRYVKSPICGSLGLQYARRYRITNALEVDKIKKGFYKTRKKYIKKVKKLRIPNLITADVELGKYVQLPVENVNSADVENETERFTNDDSGHIENSSEQLNDGKSTSDPDIEIPKKENEENSIEKQD